MIRGVLVDLSGTLHIEDMVIPGAVEALEQLRSLKVTVKFLTNATKVSQSILHNRLQTLGFKIEREEIFTSLNAARKYIDERHLRPYLMVDDDALDDFAGLTDVKDKNAVVIGLAPSKFQYHNMNIAFRLILDGAELIAIHKAKYYKMKDGLRLGPGSFVAGLEFATNKKAVVVGKPSETFFKLGLAALGTGFRAEETVMIGDDVHDDVLGAMACGMKGILVKTGKYRDGDEENIPEEKRNCVISIVEAVNMIADNKVL